MHAAFGVRQERTLEMDADGLGFAVSWCSFNRVSERFQRTQCVVDGRGHGGWQIVRDTASGEETLHLAEVCCGGGHHIMPHRTMRMDIEEGRGQCRAVI